MNPAPLSRRLFAEFLGSAFLAATVVGLGIAAAFGGLRWRHAFAYIPAQVAAASPGRSPPT